MAEAVATNGFVAPPGVNLPPANMQPGFVQNPGVAPVVTDPATQTATAAAAPDAVQAQVQALLAALQAQNAVQPVEPEVKTDEVGSPGKLNSLDITTIEDPVLRSMANIMQSVGKDLDLDRVFDKALEHGNADLLDMAYLRDKGGPNAEQLITIAKGIVQAVNAQAEAVQAGVIALAGGQQQWDSSVAAFNTGAPVELRKVVALMLNSQNKGQIDAGAKLVVEFAKGSGMIPSTNKPIMNGGSAVQAAQALTKEGFQAELRKLNPNTREYQADRASLFARRAMGRRLGQ